MINGSTYIKQIEDEGGTEEFRFYAGFWNAVDTVMACGSAEIMVALESVNGHSNYSVVCDFDGDGIDIFFHVTAL